MTEQNATEDLFTPAAPSAPAAAPPAESGPVSAPLQVTFGQQLRAAREASGKTLADCGHDLHLPIKVLQRLEADSAGAPADFVFLRGALKGYARYLGLSASACDAALRAVAPTEQPQLVSVARTSNTRWLLQRYGTAATYIILTATIAVPLVLLGLRGGLHRPAAEIVSLDQVAATPTVAKHDKLVVAPHIPAPTITPDAAPFRASIAPFSAIGLDDNVASGDTAINGAAATPPVVAGSGPHTLTVTATADCWYSITDADGNKIDSGMLHAGDVRVWHSAGVLHVTLGNSGGVSVTQDGKPLALDGIAHSNVARFDVFGPASSSAND